MEAVYKWSYTEPLASWLAVNFDIRKLRKELIIKGIYWI